MTLIFFFPLLLTLPISISSYKIKESRTRDFFIRIWKDQKIFKEDNGTEYVYAVDVDQPIHYDGTVFHWNKTAEGQCIYRITSEIKTDIVDKIIFTSTEPPKEVYWSCQGRDMCSELGCMGLIAYICGLGVFVLIAGCWCYGCYGACTRLAKCMGGS